MKKFTIQDISAREILDSRGNPTICTTVTLNNGVFGTAMIPSGASTGIHEAHELRDGDKKRYMGKGVLKAIANVNGEMKQALLKHVANDQIGIDQLLINLDGTPNKSRLGANAILSVSLACARAVSNALQISLFEYLGKDSVLLPVPMCNILNGGAHAANNIDIQEFMIMPWGAPTFAEGLRWSVEIFHSLKAVLKAKGCSTSVGDEGGFAPNLNSAEEALDAIMLAIENAGYKPGKDVVIAIDAATSEWAQKDGSYLLPKTKKHYTKEEFIAYWVDLVKKYPIKSLEDPFGEEDFDGFTKLNQLLGKKIQIMGDDLFVTNPERLLKGIEEKSANSILIKLNQIGTVSETLNTISLAQNANFTTVISHRSGETEDTSIADLAVATNSTQIKTGSLCRSERVAKYNRLLAIEQQLGDKAVYAGKNVFYQLEK